MVDLSEDDEKEMSDDDEVHGDSSFEMRRSSKNVKRVLVKAGFVDDNG